MGIFLFLLISCQKKEPSAISANASENNKQTDAQPIVVTKQQFEDAGMKLGKVQEHMFPSIVKASGYLDVPPENKASISTFMGGYVRRIPLLEGNQVKKGQFLVSLESPDYVQLQQDYLEAKEQLAYLKSEFERQKTLSQENISSQKNFLKAQSDYKTMLARYESLHKKLTLLNISPDKVESGQMTSFVSLYSPITGYVTAVHASRGMYMGPEDVIIEMVNPDHLHVELSVFEKDILQVQEGQEIHFRIPEAGSQAYEAEVHLVGKSVEGKERTVSVHGHLKDEGRYSFVPGMFLEAEILVNKRTAPGVPSEAVVNENDNNYLLVKTTEKGDSIQFEKKQVSVGQMNGDWNEIKKGSKVTADDQILIKGAFNVSGTM